MVINEALSKRKDVSNELLQGSIFCLALFKNSINLFDDGNIKIKTADGTSLEKI